MSTNLEDLIMRDTRTNQPAAGVPGRLYYVTDEFILERDNGSSWENVESSASSGIDATGWVEATEGWTYVSVDDPSGVIDATGDVRTKYSAGIRIKLTNGGNTIFGIITNVNQTLQSGNTRITFLHEIDPSDSQALYLLANSAITATYYSVVKAPVGFPLEPTKWQILVTDVTNRSQATPTHNDWYNLGSISISVPIGAWHLSYKVAISVSDSGTGTYSGFATLSTANNSESDADFTQIFTLAVSTVYIIGLFFEKNVVVTSKTAYYINTKTSTAGLDNLINRNDLSKLILRAVCAYL